MTQETIPTFPVANITVGPVPRLGYIVIRPDYLTHAMQAPEQAHAGRTYVLTPEQGRYLVEQIQKALALLETAPPPDGGDRPH